MQLEIKTIKVGYLQTNCYIVSNKENCIIIDPGDEFEKIRKEIVNNVIAILVTHNHFDHIGALSKLKNEYNVPVYDYNNLKESNLNIKGFNIEVIYSPGHTEDSVIYYFKDYNIMFTGDFLFKESIGRTDLSTGNALEMKKSIEKIKQYDGKIKIFPGHGDSTNLEYEKQNNIYLK